MNIALMQDGKYKIVSDIKNVNYLLPSIKYLVIDNSTQLKGKTCTMIDISKNDFNLSQKDNDKIMKLELSYDSIDVPINNDTIIRSSIPFVSIEKIFSIYPLIKQIFGFNYFKEIHLAADCITLYINNISVKNKDYNIDFDYDESDGCIEKYFKKLNIRTNVEDILGSKKHIILRNGKWYIDKIVPSKFEYLCYNVQGIETLYLLTEKQYNRLSSIECLSIELFENDSSSYNYLQEENEEDDPIYAMTCRTFEPIIEACIYFPQLIELEKNIYNRLLYLKIQVTTNYMTYNLEISEEETRNCELCLFKIINKLLQM